MNDNAKGAGNTVPFVPWSERDRGFEHRYHRGETNHCPGCGRTHWYIGRVLAQCGFCDTALLIDKQ